MLRLFEDTFPITSFLEEQVLMLPQALQRQITLQDQGLGPPWNFKIN